MANVSGGGRRRSTHTYTLTNEEAGAGERGRGRAGQRRRRRRREQRPSSRLGQGRRRRPRAGRACRDKQTSDMSKTSTFAAGCGSQFLSLLRLIKSPSSFWSTGQHVRASEAGGLVFTQELGHPHRHRRRGKLLLVDVRPSGIRMFALSPFSNSDCSHGQRERESRT